MKTISLPRLTEENPETILAGASSVTWRLCFSAQNRHRIKGKVTLGMYLNPEELIDFI